MKLDKKYICGIITAAVGISLLLAGSLQAMVSEIIIDDFSSGLDNWNRSGNVTNGNGEETGFAFFSTEEYVGDSSLSRAFSLPDYALSLSFYLKPLGESAPACDEFTVSLLPEHSEFYFWSSETDGTEWTPGPGVEVVDVGNDWKKITLDVSSITVKDVQLGFNLLNDNDDFASWVSLDNIVVSVSLPTIPAPGALLLAAMGAGLAGWLRKSGKLR